jgi:phage gpG-like protein
VIAFSAAINGVEVLNRAFNRIDEQITDLRSIWPAVAEVFYKAEKDQFDTQGAAGASGKWAPLSQAYKKFKEQHFPGEPILQREHSLVESLTSAEGLDSVFRPEPDQLTIGTRAPYARAHQEGRGRLPRRPVISLTETQKREMQKAIQIGLVRFARAAGFEVQEQAA